MASAFGAKQVQEENDGRDKGRVLTVDQSAAFLQSV
jgi:hypothetical protein